jgi:hypothetical protein
MKDDFSGRRKGEEVLGVFRRHVLVARKGYYVLIAMLAIGMLPIFIPLFQAAKWTGWFCLICAMIGILYLAYQYILWYYSMFILTNQRLRVISQKGFFKRTVSDLELATIASISFDTPNIFGAIFKYGTLLIQSSVGDMTILNLANPEKVYNEIQNATQEVEKKVAPAPATKKSEASPETLEPRGEIIFEDEEK